jgi:hypothetical protein
VVKAASLTLNAPETSKTKAGSPSPAAGEFRAKGTATEPARLVEPKSKHISNWNKLRNDQPVQRAGHEADPFVDPFADQGSSVQMAQATRSVRSLIQDSADGTAVPAEDTPAEPPARPAPRPRSRFQLESPADYPDDSAQPMPMPRTDPQLQEPMPREPLTREPMPQESDDPIEPRPRPSFRPMPSEESSGTPSAETCQRIYNDRNCCGSEKHCRMANELLKKMPLSRISLDITPRFKLDATNWKDHDEARDEVLKRADFRRWHDREGNVVAEGRLADLTHGHALVATANGTVRLPLGQLGEDELCFINAWWLLPPECIAASEPFNGRNWAPSTFTFTASALCHKPLYFEEVPTSS